MTQWESILFQGEWTTAGARGRLLSNRNTFGKTHHPMRIYFLSGWMNCSRSWRPDLVQSECFWENSSPNENLFSFRLDELQQELEARSRPIRLLLGNSSANENLSCFRLDELQQELEASSRHVRNAFGNFISQWESILFQGGWTSAGARGQLSSNRNAFGKAHQPMRIYLVSGWMNYSRSWRPDLFQLECFLGKLITQWESILFQGGWTTAGAGGQLSSNRNAFEKTHHPMRIYLVSWWMNYSRSWRPALIHRNAFEKTHHPMRIYLVSGWMNYSRSWRPRWRRLENVAPTTPLSQLN